MVPEVTSPLTVITFSGASNAALRVVVQFRGSSNALDGTAKSVLATFAKKVKAGDAITVTGYAHGDMALARSRASAVARYLMGRVKVDVSVKAVSRTTMHEVSLIRT